MPASPALCGQPNAGMPWHSRPCVVNLTQACAMADAALHWYHSNIRAGAARLVFNTVIAKRLGKVRSVEGQGGPHTASMRTALWGQQRTDTCGGPSMWLCKSSTTNARRSAKVTHGSYENV
eukprot:14604-Chlamydomonas_euryale.AAC.1